jgi:hypothetical protein
MKAAYSRERGERITQLQYLLQLSLRTSENPQNANFAKKEFYEVRGLACNTAISKSLPIHRRSSLKGITGVRSHYDNET